MVDGLVRDAVELIDLGVPVLCQATPQAAQINAAVTPPKQLFGNERGVRVRRPRTEYLWTTWDIAHLLD